MKLVREHIFEKFSESGDPIKEMGIGRIKFGEIYDELMPDREDEWKEIVRNLVGKIVTGKMTLNTFSGGGTSAILNTNLFREIRILVEQAQSTLPSGDIMIRGKSGQDFILSREEEYTIE
jgi:hypothetical protein